MKRCSKCGGPPVSGKQSWCNGCKNIARRKFQPGAFDALVDSRREKRFWAKVGKRGPEDCWEWTGARFSNGYGGLGFRQRVEYAHRVSFEIHFGPVPAGLFVCHRCDNPPCVNPVHLYAGTASDNSRDCSSRGRNPASKLTPEQRDEIRAKRATGALLSTLAREYGISKGRVSAISKEAAK